MHILGLLLHLSQSFVPFGLYFNKIPSSFCPVSTAVNYDKFIKAIRVKVPDSEEEFFLHPATVRRNDRSAQSVVSGSDFFFLFFSQQYPKSS